MGTIRSALRTTIRQILRDETSGDYEWEDDELNTYIAIINREVSAASPKIVRDTETFTTTDGSRELDISDIAAALINGPHSVIKVEYPTGNYPKTFKNVGVVDNETIEIKCTASPGDADELYLFYESVHTLTDSASTLNIAEEEALILGVAAKAAKGWARDHMDGINTAGSRAPADVYTWAEREQGYYREKLAALSPWKTIQSYPM